MLETTHPAEPARERPRGADRVWAPGRRRLTAGLVLTVTLVAFEALAVATVMPVVADDLGGLGLYGWVFSGFFLGSLLGIVVAGQLADQRGTRFPFVVGLVCFAAGLVVGASAQSMGMLVAGRVAQGFGAGVIPAVAYVSIGRTYPVDVRPRVFAVFSSAWVIPGLVGPAAASTIADVASWRAVFGLLIPLVALAAVMTLPALGDGPVRHGDHGDRDGPGDEPASARGAPDRRLHALVLTAGVALVLAGLAVTSTTVGLALVAAGAVPAAWAFLRLVPAGTVRLAAGLPATVAVRGVLTFALFGADAYVSLAVTEARDGSIRLAGAALTVATLTWTSGSWIQQRLIVPRGPRWLVRRGFLLIAAGIGGMLVVLTSVPPALAVLAWAIAGLGMGLAYGSLSVTTLGLAAPGREGEATAALQLTDVLGVALGTGMTGVFVTLGEARDWDVASSLTLAFLVTLAVALVGVLASGRLPQALPVEPSPG